ncbi:hypothetical protein ACHQM5_017448 [Ranunculus cassubicifolius]
MDISNKCTGIQSPGGIGSAETKKTEVKKAAVCAEMERLNQLPGSAAKGSYAIQRMRVLNKILQLMAIQRSQSQDEELELLFAGLSI